VVTEREIVQWFSCRDRQVDALRALTGGVTATHLRTARLTDAAFDAVVDGLADPNPRVRWWCLQVLDHVPEGRAVRHVASALNDPVPRVRRNAVHALGCVACKPDWDGTLAAGVISLLTEMSTSDDNDKVRREATSTLASLRSRQESGNRNQCHSAPCPPINEWAVRRMSDR
jgi:vesicle coat complex subunit